MTFQNFKYPLYHADEANRRLIDALERNAALETALKFMSRHTCLYRKRGECLLDCQDAMICDLTGLKMVQKGEKTSPLDLVQLIRDWLLQQGYDGLYSDDCGCFLDNLMPCSEPGNLTDCQPGYKIPVCSKFYDIGPKAEEPTP